jgi:hypothetical protein
MIVILWSILVFCLNLTPPWDKNRLQVTMYWFVLASQPLAFLMALGTAAGERSKNTLTFLQALPVSTRRVASVKLLSGLLSVILPLALVWLFIIGWSTLSERVNSLLMNPVTGSGSSPTTVHDGSIAFAVLVMGALSSASVYLWAAAVGVNRKDEISAAAVALAVIVFIYSGFHVVWPLLFFNRTVPPSGSIPTGIYAWSILAAAGPGSGGAMQVFDQKSILRQLYVVVGLLSHFALAAAYVYRFGRIANREVTSRQGEGVKVSAPTTIVPPRRSPLAALVWKQARESGPLVVVGIVTILAATGLIVLGDMRKYWGRPVEISSTFIVASVWIGFLVAMVIGVGAFLYDTESRIKSFWRSRPIDVDQLFFTKTVTALLILVPTMLLPAIVAFAVSGPINGHQQDEIRGFVIASAALLAVFSAAAAMTCLVRHAVYGAILSIPAALIGPGLFVLALELSLWQVPNRFVSLYVAGGFLVSVAANLLLAWLAFRNDWGVKGRG